MDSMHDNRLIKNCNEWLNEWVKGGGVPGCFDTTHKTKMYSDICRKCYLFSQSMFSRLYVSLDDVQILNNLFEDLIYK